MRSFSKLLFCTGVLGLLIGQALAAGLDDEFDEKRSAFERVAVKGNQAERERALNELVGTGNAQAVTVLTGEFARVAR